MSSESSPELRLHPLSWLFVLIGQLKQFFLPLVIVVIGGQRNNNELWGLIGVGVLALVSVAQYFTYRYRIDSDGVVIRSGLFQRSLRHIPFARIQNVALHQTVLHRLFGVAEVRLESAAGGPTPEGQMRVLRLDAAHRLEQLVRDHGGTAAAHVEASGEPAAPLLVLSTAEVIRLGLIDNRGLLVIGGLFAYLAQVGDNLIGKLFNGIGQWMSGQATALHMSTEATIFAGVALLVLALVLVRLFSVTLALLQFSGFTLRDENGRLSVERGLLTRMRGSVPRGRIQAFSLREGVLHRLFGRRNLRVDTAVLGALNEKAAIRDLAPIATPEVTDGLIDRLLPQAAWPVAEWLPLHPRAWRRKFALPALLTLAATAILMFFRGPWGLLLLLALPLLFWRARLWARRSGYSVANGLVAFRGGWLDRHWRFAESRKLQALELLQSPFDRRHGMATLRFDTAGASPMEPGLKIPYLPEADARAIYAELTGVLGRRR